MVVLIGRSIIFNRHIKRTNRLLAVRTDIILHLMQNSFNVRIIFYARQEIYGSSRVGVTNTLSRSIAQPKSSRNWSIVKTPDSIPMS